MAVAVVAVAVGMAAGVAVAVAMAAAGVAEEVAAGVAAVVAGMVVAVVAVAVRSEHGSLCASSTVNNDLPIIDDRLRGQESTRWSRGDGSCRSGSTHRRWQSSFQFEPGWKTCVARKRRR